MKARSWVLVLLCLAASCSDENDMLEPTVECIPSCGPTDLALVSADVILPAGRTHAYSGDTVEISILIRNLTALTADSVNAYVRLEPGALDLHFPIGRVPADTTLTRTLRVALPLAHGFHDTATVRRFNVSVWPAIEVSFGNNGRDTNAFTLRPTTVRLNGPDTIVVGQPSTFHFLVTNPSPRLLRSAVLSTCYMYNNCLTPVLSRVTAPVIPAGGTVSVPIVVTVPFNAETMKLPVPGYVVTCYGDVYGHECGSARAVLRNGP